MTDEAIADAWLDGKYLENMGVRRPCKVAFLAGLKVKVKELSTETLLKELIDRKVIRSWYYNGTYHVGNELPKGE